MFHLRENASCFNVELKVEFGGEELCEGWGPAQKSLWKTEGFGGTQFFQNSEVINLHINWGDFEKLTLRKVKELFAIASKNAEKLSCKSCCLMADAFVMRFGEAAIYMAAEGLLLGQYCFSYKTGEKTANDISYYIVQNKPAGKEAGLWGERAWHLAEEICFVKNAVNMPANLLRPEDFADMLEKRAAELGIAWERIAYEDLLEQGYAGICAVGGSSAYKPCMLILRYTGAPESSACIGIVGKGVTCDTGGYCLKESRSMPGIKGDMAGAAAAAAALFAAAENEMAVNAVVCLPLCENRISPDAMLPGDILEMYGGKTVEILNTDAEGRLVLADGAAHLLKNENVCAIVDIATLTGSAYGALGHTMAPVMCDDESLYNCLEQAGRLSNESFVRFPFGEEHERMIKSKAADIKNTGGDCCQTIVAGLFVREFTNNLPWLHIDIAGTAWTDKPDFSFESFGATGAGTSTLYHLMSLFMEKAKEGENE